MAPDQSYPSPTAAQVSGGAGPFFQHNGDQSQIPPEDLQQLQAAADRSLEAPLEVQGNGNDGYVQHHSGEHDEMLQVQATSPERMAQGVLNMSDNQSQEYSPAEQGAARKRSKVSRACDECRRKKIRCDSAADLPDEPCSSCKRTGANCQFSRQPMKRGPSKGYIKELADRLNNLESQIGPHVHSQLQHQQPDLQYLQSLGEEQLVQHEGFSPPPGLQMSRKRTHSMSGDRYLRDIPYGAVRNPADSWNNDSQRLAHALGGLQHPQTPQTIHNELRAPFSPNEGSSIWRQTIQDVGRREELTIQYEPAPREPDASVLIEWDEGIVDEYYRIIHQTFPLLPHSKMRLRSRLANCVSTLREAFLSALECAIRSSPLTSLRANNDPRQSTRKTAELISASQYDKTSDGTMSSNVIYVQTLILMALESDNHGPATMRGKIGPPRSEWLGRAIGMATHLKLNVPRSRESMLEGDADSDDRLGRRVWWILFILDRWHASSTASLIQIADHSSSLLAEDQLILGESTYHIARLSFILGHLCAILQQPASLMDKKSAVAPILSLTITGEIDRFRESIEGLLLAAPNLVHLAYWHVRLMILRLTAASTPHELLNPATRMASILNSAHTTITPLNHHFAALAALTLMELCAFDETRSAAEKGIEDIIQALNTRRGLMSREDSTGWDSGIRELVMRRNGVADGLTNGIAPIAGLQHLADVASNRRAGTPTTGGADDSAFAQTHTSPEAAAKQQSEGSVAGGSFDPTALTRYGYLAALVQDNV